MALVQNSLRSCRALPGRLCLCDTHVEFPRNPHVINLSRQMKESTMRHVKDDHYALERPSATVSAIPDVLIFAQENNIYLLPGVVPSG